MALWLGQFVLPRMELDRPITPCYASGSFSLSSLVPPDPCDPDRSFSPAKTVSLRSQAQPVDMRVASPNAVGTAPASSHGLSSDAAAAWKMLAAIQANNVTGNTELLTSTAGSGFGGAAMACSTVASALNTCWINPGS